MPITANPANFPRVDGAHKDVVAGGPTAVLGAFLEVARERFRGDDLPWVYAPNLTGATTETGQVGNARKLQIELGFSPAAVARNYRPSIYLTRGEVRAQKAVIGNLAGVSRPQEIVGYYATAPLPLDFEVVAGTGGESSNIADALWFYFAANRDIIRKLYGVRDITLPSLGETVVGERDRNEWVTHVRFEAETTMRWLTKPISPRLQSLIFQLNDPSSGQEREIVVNTAE